jgi:hypothetical protein
MAQGSVFGGEVASVAPRLRFKAEVEDAIEFVEGDAHIEAGLGGDEAGAASGLHDGQAFEIEPTRLRRWLRCAEPGVTDYGWDGGVVFFGFESGAEWSDAVFDEVEAGALHDVVLGVVGGGDDFFGDTEGGTDFGAGEFVVFEEPEIGGGEGGLNDLGGVPEEERIVGSAGTASAVAELGEDLLALGFFEGFGGTDDEAEVGVVFEETAHEGGGGEVGFGGQLSDPEGGKAE